VKSSSARAAQDTRIFTAAEVSVWFKSAIPGDTFVYCIGPAMMPGPTQTLVRKLIETKRAGTHKRRGAGGRLEHYLVKLAPPPRSRAAPPAAPIDQAAAEILAALERCVERRRRAYSDQELAKIAGLATRNQARWRLRKLEEAGAVSIETVEGPDRTAWRIVAIGGRRSAAPPARGGRHD
jgi:hypothetical protein